MEMGEKGRRKEGRGRMEIYEKKKKFMNAYFREQKENVNTLYE